MTSQLSSAGCKQSQPGELARQQIEKVVAERLVGRKIDAVAFVEDLLAIAIQVGQVTCSPVAERGLRFELAGCDPFEITLDGNRGKIRMLCARLAVLCQESGDDFLPYGGEGTIRRAAQLDVVARWANTPGKQEFTVSVVR